MSRFDVGSIASALTKRPMWRPSAMDYKRIYFEFIKDRRGKESCVLGYSERHHILPRALGGSDDPANLVRLSFEDHFFAHLLLARIHGGKMASALWMMVNSSSATWSTRFKARKAYAMAEKFASQKMSEAWCGKGNPLYNPTVYDWSNIRTGERLSATLHAMNELHGGNRPHWTNVARENRPSYKGWVLTKNVGTHARSEKGQSFKFINRNGKSFKGTQSEFAKKHGLNAASCSRIVRHQSVTKCGWRLLGTKDRPSNWAKDGKPSRLNREQSAT